jgi:hypothetical protein
MRSSATQITPNLNVAGRDLVPVRAKDGAADSKFSLAVNVTPINDPPVITADAESARHAEDTRSAIALATSGDGSGLTVSTDSRSRSPGTGYAVVGNQITPNQNLNGALKGLVMSAMAQLTRTVQRERQRDTCQ